MAEGPPRILRLVNPVRQYAWGSRVAIAELLGETVPAAQPQAELWMGAHGQGSSQVEVDGQLQSLRQWLQASPRWSLGRDLAEEGDELRFLLKVLAAEQPLSVQAHPDAEQARDGYARETAAGIALDAPHRNYRDRHAKPEILVAMTPFALIRGFRSPTEISTALREVGIGDGSPLQAALVVDDGAAAAVQSALRGFLETSMALDDVAVERLQTLVAGHLDPARPSHRWVERLCRHHRLDRGFLAPLWLHYVELAPGEAIFTPPGILHAYLEGVGIELMGCSDNVLRGGLTVKHVDLPELFEVVRFAEQPPHILRPRRGVGGEQHFDAPTDVFRLSRLQPDDPMELTVEGPEILLCTEGATELRCAGQRLALRRGDSVFIAAAAGPIGLRGEGVVYRAREGRPVA